MMAVRIQGNAVQRADRTWGWEATITFPDGESLSGSLPADKPGFLRREAAVEDMRKDIARIVETIKDKVDAETRIIDLKKGEFVEKI